MFYQSCFYFVLGTIKQALHFVLYLFSLVCSSQLSILVFLFNRGNSFQKKSPGSVLQERCSQKFRKIHRKAPVSEFHFNKVTVACNFIKKDILAQVFSCKFCEISKNTFLTERLRDFHQSVCVILLVQHLLFFSITCFSSWPSITKKITE